MGGLASPSRTSNLTQLSPRIAGIGCRLAPMEPPPHYPVARWQAGSNGQRQNSLIPVPDWPSLISLVRSRRPLSWASLLWRQGGLGAAREKGKSARYPLPAAPSHSTVPHSCLLPSSIVQPLPRDQQADSATVSFCMVRLPPRFLTESTRIETRTVSMASWCESPTCSRTR